MRDIYEKYVAEKLVSVQKHPIADYFIYNYTPIVQYKRLWDEHTLKARGLILDLSGNVIARPFPKFFNYEEHTEFPSCPFEVYEKMDGSLGILYWFLDKPFIATRGAFYSEQAIEANKILHEKYSHTFDKLDKSKTYLFEIIYPENRIVVDYGKTRDLVLIGIIDLQTGEEMPLEDIGFTLVKRYNGDDYANLSRLRELQSSEGEGFVIRFESGLRLKMKYSEYVRLHRIITGVSNVTIWEYLSQGRPLSELLDRVPDEFYGWVERAAAELQDKYKSVLTQCLEDFTPFETRKESALYFQTKDYPSVLFNLLDEKPVDSLIWKTIKPKYSKPFKQEC